MKKSLLFLILFSFSLCLSAGELPSELKPLTERVKTLVKEKDTLPVVAIAGCPGVGKSTFATKLANSLKREGINCLVISQDHYIKTLEERKIYTNELDPRRLKWDWIHQNMQEIKKRKESITKPYINQLTREHGTETYPLTDVDCIISEGLYTLGSVPPMDFMQYTDLAIYMETPLENTFDWKWERDLKKTRTRTPEEFYEHMMTICRDFAFHIYYTKANADYIIDVDNHHNYSLREVDKSSLPAMPDFTEYRLQKIQYL